MLEKFQDCTLDPMTLSASPLSQMQEDDSTLLLHPSRIFSQFEVPLEDIDSADYKTLHIGFNSVTWVIACNSAEEVVKDEKKNSRENGYQIDENDIKRTDLSIDVDKDNTFEGEHIDGYDERLVIDEQDDDENNETTFFSDKIKEEEQRSECNQELLNDDRFHFPPIETDKTEINMEKGTHNKKKKYDKYVLQRINHEVFHSPENIDHNNRLLLAHIDQYHPNMIFPHLYPTKKVAEAANEKENGGSGGGGATVLHDSITGNYYRLYEFMSQSYCHRIVDSLERAYESARIFANFGRVFSTPLEVGQVLIHKMRVTYPDYHNLLLRHEQFLTALTSSTSSLERQSIAREEVEELHHHEDILWTFKEIAGIDEVMGDPMLMRCTKDVSRKEVIHDPAITITACQELQRHISVTNLESLVTEGDDGNNDGGGSSTKQTNVDSRRWAHGDRINTKNIIHTVPTDKLVARVTHHDCKISNMLFHRSSHKGLCVIDLDTAMPGYFLSDLGALYRTSLPPGDEESTDFSQVYVRMDYFEATSRGYLEEMRSVLTDFELQYLVYAGEFMIYMQCISYLTDFLRGDVYYKVKHPLHNYVRAQNQLKLLKSYRSLRNEMKEVIDRILCE